MSYTAAPATVLVLSVDGGRWIQRSSIPVASTHVTAIDFSPDGSVLAYSTDWTSQLGSNLATYDLVAERPLASSKYSRGAVSILRFLPDGGTLAVGDDKGNVVFFSTDLGSEVRSINAAVGSSSFANSATALCFSENGEHLHVGLQVIDRLPTMGLFGWDLDMSGEVSSWSTKDGRCRSRLQTAGPVLGIGLVDEGVIVAERHNIFRGTARIIEQSGSE